MEEIIKRIKNEKYDLRDCALLDIVQFKLEDEIISLEELESIKSLVDYTIENIKEQDKEIF